MIPAQNSPNFQKQILVDAIYLKRFFRSKILKTGFTGKDEFHCEEHSTILHKSTDVTVILIYRITVFTSVHVVLLVVNCKQFN